MVAFPFRLPMGIAGMVTKIDAATIESAQWNTGAMPQRYGDAVIVDVNGVRAVTGTDTKIDGYLVRPFPTSGNGTDGLGVATPVATSGNASILKRGYIMVKLGGVAAAVRDAAAFVRVANPSSGKVVGDTEAAADLAATTAPKGGNTGNATIAMDATTPVNLATAQAGQYSVVWTTATAFNVFDPQGRSLGSSVNGATFNDQIKFVATAGGTPMVAGDTIFVNVAGNTVQLDSKSYFTGPADASGFVEVAFNI